jgi:hypothetical protein
MPIFRCRRARKIIEHGDGIGMGNEADPSGTQKGPIVTSINFSLSNQAVTIKITTALPSLRVQAERIGWVCRLSEVILFHQYEESGVGALFPYDRLAA